MTIGFLISLLLFSLQLTRVHEGNLENIYSLALNGYPLYRLLGFNYHILPVNSFDVGLQWNRNCTYFFIDGHSLGIAVSYQYNCEWQLALGTTSLIRY